MKDLRELGLESKALDTAEDATFSKGPIASRKWVQPTISINAGSRSNIFNILLLFKGLKSNLYFLSGTYHNYPLETCAMSLLHRSKCKERRKILSACSRCIKNVTAKWKLELKHSQHFVSLDIFFLIFVHAEVLQIKKKYSKSKKSVKRQTAAFYLASYIFENNQSLAL